jgi:hypothetical protein
MAIGPFDLLKNKNSTWQDIAGALWGSYKSKSKRERREKLLAMGFLSWMGAKEGRMIANTNRKLMSLNTEQIAEKAKLVEKHRKTNLVFDDLDKFDTSPTYFKTLAATEFDAAPESKNYWYNVGGELGERSELAQQLRNEKIDSRAKGLENQMWAKLGYTANKDGEFNIDPATRRPYLKDDPSTKSYTEKFTGEQIANVRARQTQEEFLLPFNTYYNKREEGLLRPENISWAHKALKRIGIGDKAAAAFKTDVKTLKTLYEKQTKLSTNIVSPFIQVIDIEGSKVPTPEGHSAFDFKLPKKDLKISRKEAISRIMYEPGLDSSMKQNAVIEVNKKFKGKEAGGKKISIDELSLAITDEFMNYNATLEVQNKQVQAFDAQYSTINQEKFIKAGITGNVEAGLDWNTVRDAKYDTNLNLINTKTTKPYSAEIKAVRQKYASDLSVQLKTIVGMDATVDKLLGQVRELNNLIESKEFESGSVEHKALTTQLLNYTVDDFTKSELSLADTLIISPTNKSIIEGSIDITGYYDMDEEQDDGTMKTRRITDYAQYGSVTRMNALRRGKRTYEWLVENF